LGSISATVYQMSLKSDDFSLEIWWFNNFQNCDHPPSWILKNLQFLSCRPCRPAVLLPHTKFRWNRTISRWVIAKKAIFKMAAILNFKKFNFWSSDCNRVQYLMRCAKFHQNPTIFTAQCVCISAVYAMMRCPSVCLFVKFVSCAKTNKDIFEFFSPSRSHTILVFPYQTGWRYYDRNPPNGGVE